MTTDTAIETQDVAIHNGSTVAFAPEDHAPVQEQYSLAVIKAIESLATSPDVDIDKMQRLLDVQERIMDKAAETAFCQARAAMQGDIPAVRKTKQNGHTKSRYASLEDIHKVVHPVLSAHGFSISYKNEQPTQPNHVRVTATLSHVSGHSETNTVELPYDTQGAKSAVQAIGSSLTYAERYALCGLLSITLTDDDDGNTGGMHKITTEQAADFDTRIRALPDAEDARPKFLKYMKANSIQDIQAKDYAKANAALSAKEKGTKA